MEKIKKQKLNQIMFLLIIYLKRITERKKIRKKLIVLKLIGQIILNILLKITQIILN